MSAAIMQHLSISAIFNVGNVSVMAMMAANGIGNGGYHQLSSSSYQLINIGNIGVSSWHHVAVSCRLIIIWQLIS